jgi:hypothetical protein
MTTLDKLELAAYAAAAIAQLAIAVWALLAALRDRHNPHKWHWRHRP